LLLVPEIIGDENLVSVVAGENEVGSFALEVGREQQVRVRNRDGRGIGLRENRRDVVVRVERFGWRVNHDVIPSDIPDGSALVSRRRALRLCELLHTSARLSSQIL
jgi:hypothetical protein